MRRESAPKSGQDIDFFALWAMYFSEKIGTMQRIFICTEAPLDIP